MAYAIQDDIMGLPPIAATDTVQRMPEGTICHAIDPVAGGGEFIYLKGAANTVVGSLVTYDQQNHTTTLAPSTANLGQPLAVAMSANVALQWGWYCITGNVLVAKDASVFAANASLGLGSAAGQVGTNSAGKQVLGARTTATAATGVGTVAVQLSRPHAQGAIT